MKSEVKRELVVFMRKIHNEDEKDKDQIDESDIDEGIFNFVANKSVEVFSNKLRGRLSEEYTTPHEIELIIEQTKKEFQDEKL